MELLLPQFHSWGNVETSGHTAGHRGIKNQFQTMQAQSPNSQPPACYPPALLSSCILGCLWNTDVPPKVSYQCRNESWELLSRKVERGKWLAWRKLRLSFRRMKRHCWVSLAALSSTEPVPSSLLTHIQTPLLVWLVHASGRDSCFLNHIKFSVIHTIRVYSSHSSELLWGGGGGPTTGSSSETQVTSFLQVCFSIQNQHVQVLGAFCIPYSEREAHMKEVVEGRPGK